MIICLIVVWNWVEFETFWKLNEREWNDFPRLSICLFLFSMNSNSFHHKTLEWKWYDFFQLKWKGFLKRFEFHLKIFQIQKLYETQWFSWEKKKWLLQIIWNMSGKFKRIKFKVPLELFSNWSYLGFTQIIFLQK